MGTWGFKPFENDAACDFADAFESGGWRSVESTINRRLTRDDSDNQLVIAACEFVALANGHPRRGYKGICDGLTEWLDENPGFRPSIKLTQKAVSRSRMIHTPDERATTVIRMTTPT